MTHEGHYMVIDCFTFWAELDVLEWRLAELYPVVDQFVIVEATRTHKGDPKPLYFAENRQRFARWNDKVTHIVVGDLPGGDSQAAIWRREISQRQAIERGIRDAPDDALVMVSDLDEIPRREVVAQLKNVEITDAMLIVFLQQLYYYNVNTVQKPPRWLGTRMTHASNVRALTPDGVRWEGLKTRSTEYPISIRIDGRIAGLPEGTSAGWHLSYFGDVDHVARKMMSFLHQELVNDEHLDPDTIARRMREGLDIWGRTAEQQFEIGPASDLPWAIRTDPPRWERYFHPDWRPTFHENWYGAEQAAVVADIARHAPQDGLMVEVGCWEGRSTVALAQAIAPNILHCVDHWKGNPDEKEDHPATAAAAERDVYATFKRNMELLTPGNVRIHCADWREWITAVYVDEPVWHARPAIAFLHLDAAHDYQSVYDCLVAVKPFLVPGAIICGDDGYADGVYRGTRDALGDGVHDIGGRLWAWQNMEGVG